jgi:8-oxo-dGTP diphosphatase
MISNSPIDWTQWTATMPATILFIIQEGKILLIEKKRGLGAGKINGPGGKIDPGETSLAAAIRETQEELMITPHAPRKLGELWFSMSGVSDILCHIYRSDGFDGTPTETDEATPVWSRLDDIPYDRMWEDDRHWLPHLLSETTFLGKFVFEGDRMLWSDIQTGMTW